MSILGDSSHSLFEFQPLYLTPEMLEWQPVMDNLKKLVFSIPGIFSISISIVKFSQYSWEEIVYILGGMLISTAALLINQHFETKKTQFILENNSNQLHHIGTTISHLANKGFTPEEIIQSCKPLEESSSRIKELLQEVTPKREK